jgi:hypothetical protein
MKENLTYMVCGDIGSVFVSRWLSHVLWYGDETWWHPLTLEAWSYCPEKKFKPIIQVVPVL